MYRCALYLVIGLLCPAASDAEIIRKYFPIIVSSENPSVFALVGDIDSRTALNFDRAVGDYGVPEVIILSSDGGLVTNALIVAGRIHSLGIRTLIPADSECYSACALIFLAGKHRVAEGELGVHQITSASADLQTGQTTISDILDVLSDFDVPSELLVNMFRTPPDQMYILSEDEKRRYAFLEYAASPNSPSNQENLESMALKFMMEYNSVWSLQNQEALARVGDFYADEVNFYGKRISRQAVEREKADFALRWPLRKYSVQGETLVAACNGTTCSVSGNVEWYAHSDARAATSTGVAYFRLSILWTDERFRIVEEDGRVLQRN